MEGGDVDRLLHLGGALEVVVVRGARHRAVRVLRVHHAPGEIVILNVGHVAERVRHFGGLGVALRSGQRERRRVIPCLGVGRAEAVGEGEGRGAAHRVNRLHEITGHVVLIMAGDGADLTPILVEQVLRRRRGVAARGVAGRGRFVAGDVVGVESQTQPTDVAAGGERRAAVAAAVIVVLE